MKRILLCGLVLTVCCLGAGSSEAAAIKSSVDTDWATSSISLSNANEGSIILAHGGYGYGQGCYYGPPRRYRSYWGGPGYGGGYYYPRRQVYYGSPYGHRSFHRGGFGLYIGF